MRRMYRTLGALGAFVLLLLAAALALRPRPAPVPAPAPAPAPEGDPAPSLPTFATLEAWDTPEAVQAALYSVDQSAYLPPADIRWEEWLRRDFTTDLGGEGPKVLIFHTHASEAYADSRPGQDGVVAVGAALARVLARDYGVTVVHDRGRYDGGSPPRPNSYEVMEPAARKLLEKYPTLEVLVDLHRDALPQGMRLVTDIDGQPAAKLMFFNGVTRLNLEGQPVPPGLHNPYLQDNLAFSFQAQLVANALYPGLMRRIYIRPYRYSLHLRPKSLLVEVGSDANTYQEALNAVGPLAEILVTVLGGAR